MEATECSGLWWLPGDEGRRVAGTLKVAAGGGMRLSLVGTLGASQSPLAGKRHPIILGSVNRSPKGNDVTLTGSFLIGSTIGSFIDSREEYQVGRGYFGALLPEQSDFAFESMRLRIGGLSEWIHPLSGFDHAFPRSGEVGESVSLGSYTRRPPVSAEVPGGSILMGFGLSGNVTMTECSFREEAEVVVKSQAPITADEFNHQYGYALRSLMTFVSDKAQPIERFGVCHPDAPDHEILVVGELIQPGESAGKRKASWHELLFTLQDVDFAGFITRWLRLTAEHSAACNVFFGLLYGPPSFIDVTFQNVANAVQLYYSRRGDGAAQRASDQSRMEAILGFLPPSDRGWLVDRLGESPRVPFRTALHSLVEKHGDAIDPLISGRRDRFIDRVLGTLEYVVWREPGYEPAASFGADLYWLTQKLRFLLKACFLHEVGFSAEDIRLHFGRNALYQHIYQQELAREAGAGRGDTQRQTAGPAGAPLALKGSPEFEEFWGYLRLESPRSRAVVIGAYFDDRLGQMLGTPEDSFRAKIETAYRKGMLTANERDDLDEIRRLRNLVVHQLGGPQFTDEERRIVEGLKTWRIAAEEAPPYVTLVQRAEDRLLYVAAVIAGRLKRRVGGTEALPEPDFTDVRSWPPITTL